MRFVDPDLELRADWETHVGADIGGNPPSKTGWNDLAGAREFYVKGPAYADVLYAVHRSLQSKAGIVRLLFDFMTDANAQSQLRCFELDTIITLNKLKYNMSSQFNNASGMLDIAKADGSWASTGIKVRRFIPWQWYQLGYDYWFDSTAKKFSLLAVTVNGQKSSIPLLLQNLTAVSTDWADVISLQVQLDLDGAGGGCSVFTHKMDYVWEL